MIHPLSPKHSGSRHSVTLHILVSSDHFLGSPQTSEPLTTMREPDAREDFGGSPRAFLTRSSLCFFDFNLLNLSMNREPISFDMELKVKYKVSQA